MSAAPQPRTTAGGDGDGRSGAASWARPWRWLPEGALVPLLAVAASAVVLLTGALSPRQAGALLDRTWSVLVFLVAAAVLAALAGRAGVFEVAAVWAARRGGGRTWRLWLLVVGIAVAATTTLSLDTTAVLLTPVVLALARRTGAPASVGALLALTCAWLANTASLLLPVSNLTNLLALGVLEGGPAGGGVLAFAALTWRPALAAVLATALVLAVLHRGALRTGYSPPRPAHVADPVLLRVAAAVVVLVLPALAAGLEPWAVAGAAAVVLAAVFAVRQRSALSWQVVPLPLAVSVLGLFVVVEALGQHGLSSALAAVAGRGEGFPELLRLAATSAVAANAVDNLPAYLALQPLLSPEEPLRTAAVLVGVNAGPLITPWGSLAVLLWARACRAEGVPVRWGRFALQGLVLVPVVLVAAVGALVL
ncbi:SLC13 family permease [Quadrisphaera sp. KR29]|uniref:SLC13 family permease n=1 Tax=Quadrisphaera sp. KR29 TaxID=3461391 RepID=UPI00404511CA